MEEIAFAMTVGPEFATEMLDRLGGATTSPSMEVNASNADRHDHGARVRPLRRQDEEGRRLRHHRLGPASTTSACPRRRTRSRRTSSLITPDKVREIIKVSQEPVSLETPIGEEEDSHLGDFIEDRAALAPADAASHQLLKEQVEAVLDSLSGRERRVLQLRFGLEDGRSRTLEEVGKEFNVTRERIRQIEAKALRKLRHPSRSRKLKDYLE